MNTPQSRQHPGLRASLFAAGILALAASHSAATVIVTDVSPGLNRTDAPSSSNVQWMIQTALNTSASSDTAVLTIPAGTAATSIAGYFTPSGSPAALAVGDTLSASFTFSVSNIGTATGTTAFRLGLFNSGGSRASDGFSVGAPGTIFTNYTGYAPLMSTRANASGITMRERVTGTNDFLNATTNPPFSAALVTGASQAFVANTNYTVTIAVARTSLTQVQLSTTLTGGAFSNYGVNILDNTASATEFDTIAIGWAGNLMAAGGVFSLQSAEVTLVPEPSVSVAIVAAGCLGFVILRRKRRTVQ